MSWGTGDWERQAKLYDCIERHWNLFETEGSFQGTITPSWWVWGLHNRLNIVYLGASGVPRVFQGQCLMIQEFSVVVLFGKIYFILKASLLHSLTFSFYSASNLRTSNCFSFASISFSLIFYINPTAHFSRETEIVSTFWLATPWAQRYFLRPTRSFRCETLTTWIIEEVAKMMRVFNCVSDVEYLESQIYCSVYRGVALRWMEKPVAE